jgi:hypothetical protein
MNGGIRGKSDEVLQEGYMYLENAIQLLNKDFGVDISMRFFLELVEKNNAIKLYWNLTGRLARKVERGNLLAKPVPVPFHSIDPTSRLAKKLKTGPISRIQTTWDDPLKIIISLNEAILSPNTVPYVLYKPIQKQPTLIRGPVALEFDKYNLSMMDWLHSKATGASKHVLSYDGVVVSTPEGLWQLVSQKNKKIFATDAFPEVSELIVSVSDIQKFISDLGMLSGAVDPNKNVHTSYLNIIGALLALLSKSTRKKLLTNCVAREDPIKGVTPPPYSSDEKVIEAIGLLLEPRYGLKSTNLGKKFNKARASLLEDIDFPEDEE